MNRKQMIAYIIENNPFWENLQQLIDEGLTFSNDELKEIVNDIKEEINNGK